MLLTRLYLRNFRVFEDELELDLPPGLVGVYGPNGAGKSTLLESVTWTLWGRARTGKEEVRSAGVGRDCVTEVEFEHEGHLYLVRRTLSGASSSVRAEAHCDGLGMAEGVRDTTRYVHSVLGMDDGAFRASVFAEQKQLAAFSAQAPDKRRQLVLQLLGVTPLDDARDRARKDARDTARQHEHLRGLLPDLDALGVAAADADAAAGAAEAEAAEEESAATTAQSRAQGAADELAKLGEQRQEYDRLVIEGRGQRAELDAATNSVATLQAELESLARAAGELVSLEGQAAGLADSDRRLRLLDELLRAARARDALTVPAEPEAADEASTSATGAEAEAAQRDLARIEGRRRGAEEELVRARDAASRAESLSGEADCPLCGQSLGPSFAQVQTHRRAELTSAEARLEQLVGDIATRSERARDAAAAAAEAAAAQKAAVAARGSWEQAVARAADLDADVERAIVALAADDGTGTDASGGSGAPAVAAVPSVEELVDARSRLDEAAAAQRAAAAAADRIRGQLLRRDKASAQLADAQERAATADGTVQALRDKLKALAFDPAALAASEAVAAETASAARAAEQRAQTARLTATQRRERADGEARRLAEAQSQHAQLAQLEDDTRHLTRLAELLAGFRNTVVASVGPRLAVQAAELFAELTDHEYDQLEVDADTYQLQITDAGHTYGLDRFSGSEVDLANLALRVAISEHVRFQTGGSVGLLVLDEVFGPLDEDRTARMLLALERLRGRFRQIVVVTHAGDIKDQLPNAIEVVKRPGRRATARVLNA